MYAKDKRFISIKETIVEPQLKTYYNGIMFVKRFFVK